MSQAKPQPPSVGKPTHPNFKYPTIIPAVNGIRMEWMVRWRRVGWTQYKTRKFSRKGDAVAYYNKYVLCKRQPDLSELEYAVIYSREVSVWTQTSTSFGPVPPLQRGGKEQYDRCVSRALELVSETPSFYTKTRLARCLGRNRYALFVINQLLRDQVLVPDLRGARLRIGEPVQVAHPTAGK